jgi:hypothetical protein
MYVSSVSSVLRRCCKCHICMFSKVDRMLHLAPSSPRCLHLLSASARYRTRGVASTAPPLLLNAGDASWDGGAAWDGGAVRDAPPRVHAGTCSFCSVMLGRDRCARFFCYVMRSNGSCSSNRMAPGCV